MSGLHYEDIQFDPGRISDIGSGVRAALSGPYESMAFGRQETHSPPVYDVCQ